MAGPMTLNLKLFRAPPPDTSLSLSLTSWEKEIGGPMEEKEESGKGKEKSVAPVSWTVLAWMLLGSMMGGLLLGWWECQFHSDYEQLWMVPMGLILLVTPIIAFSSIVISGVCCIPTAAIHSLDDDPETPSVKIPSL